MTKTNGLSTEELAQITERCEKATDGEWGWALSYDGGWFLSGDTIIGTSVRNEDGEFIANARQDIPKLLAEIERLNWALSRIAGKTLSHYVSTSDYKADLPSIRIAREALGYDED